MTNLTVAQLRRQLLDQKGIIPAPVKSKAKSKPRRERGTLAQKVFENQDPKKTREMLRLEYFFGKSMYVLLAPDRRGIDIAEELGVSASVVSRWRERLGIIVSSRRRYKHERERAEHDSDL